MIRRYRWLGAGVLAVVLAGGIAVTLLGSRHDTTTWVELQHGVYRGEGWQLMAKEQGSSLCLELEPTDPSADGSGWPAGCGFNDKHPGSGFFTDGVGPAKATTWFGPLPTAATQIRVAHSQVIQSYPLPRGHGLPSGRFWIFIPPSGWPDAATGPAVDPQPLDQQGNPVPFKDF